MRTYTHGLIGYLIYIKSTADQRILATLGAMLPDLFLVIGFIFHFTPELPSFEAAHNLFHQSILHTVTELFHSVLFSGVLLIICFIWLKRYVPFFVGMLSHVIVDFLTHQKWGYNIMFPIPFPIFSSPLSYMTEWFTVIEHVLFLGIIIWLWKKK